MPATARLGSGAALDVALPSAGTAGVIRFDRSVEDVMETIMAEWHERHYGIVFGDVRPQLHARGPQLSLAVTDFSDVI